MSQKPIKPIAAAVGAAFLASVAISPLASAAENPFQTNELSSGYNLAGKHGGEGRCGEGKCGEGKCGEKKAKKEGKCGEGKCGEKKAKKEGKCGEGKCGDKKDDKSKQEGKCGEGKCGEGKCGGNT